MEDLYQYGSGVLLAYSVFILGLLSPGPNAIAVMGASMGSGRKFGLSLAAGMGLGSFFWGALTVTGLVALLTAYSFLLSILKIFGAFYFLLLAYKSFRAACSTHDVEVVGVETSLGVLSHFQRGLLIQMTNPKAALTWVAILSLAVEPQAPVWVAVLIVTGCGVLSLLGYGAYAVIFSARPMQVLYRRFRRWVEGGLGVFFCVASFKLAVSRT